MTTPKPLHAIALLGAGAFLAASSSAHAQGLFERLFGAPRMYQPPVYYVPAPRYEPARPVETRPERRAPAVSYSPPPVMPKKAKPARAMSEQEVVSSILSDPTLERGDVVVFPDGPRVFKGRDRAPRKLSDFEDLSKSRLVSKSVRQTVLAKTGPDAATVAIADRTLAQRAPEVQDVAAMGSVSSIRGSRR